MADYVLRDVLPDANGIAELLLPGHAFEIQETAGIKLETQVWPVDETGEAVPGQALIACPGKLEVARFTKLVFRLHPDTLAIGAVPTLRVKVWTSGVRVAAVQGDDPTARRWTLLALVRNSVLGAVPASGHLEIFDSQDMPGVVDPTVTPGVWGTHRMPIAFYTVLLGADRAGKIAHYAHMRHSTSAAVVQANLIQWDLTNLVATNAAMLSSGNGRSDWAYQSGSGQFQNSTRMFMPYPPSGIILELINDDGANAMQYEGRIYGCVGL